MLLDTHVLYWLVVSPASIREDALVAIGNSQTSGRLFVSAISAWELSLAARKPLHRDRPQLGSNVSAWFRAAVRAVSAKVIVINEGIAIEAADVPATTGHKDPGDCLLVATARRRKLPIITRDALIIGMARRGYVGAIAC